MTPTVLPAGEYHHTGRTVIWGFFSAAGRITSTSRIAEKSPINGIGADLK
jgi:hypothetical protein